jgi:hypothetical protein
MRIDVLMIILGLLLLAAMVLTLLYGKEYSRHGYGFSIPKQSSIIDVELACSFPSTSHKLRTLRATL